MIIVVNFSNLSNWKEEAWKKKSGLQWDSNPWPPRYRCDVLPTELWSHTLGARSINWVSYLPVRSEMMVEFFTFIYNRSSNMNYFIYTSHERNIFGPVSFIQNVTEYWIFSVRTFFIRTLKNEINSDFKKVQGHPQAKSTTGSYNKTTENFGDWRW